MDGWMGGWEGGCMDGGIDLMFGRTHFVLLLKFHFTDIKNGA